MPVPEDEVKTTLSVSVYYVPVRMNSTQYSARIIAKEYTNGGVVFEDMSLYNVTARKEKTPLAFGLNPQKEVGQDLAELSFDYKVKDLIHNTQAQDREILGLSKDFRTKFSRKRDEEYKAAVERGDEKKAGEMVRDAAAKAMPDTKVVDADGKPLVVYHGTPIAGFTEFYTEESLAWVSASEDQAKITEVTMSRKKDFIQTIR